MSEQVGTVFEVALLPLFGGPKACVDGAYPQELPLARSGLTQLGVLSREFLVVSAGAKIDTPRRMAQAAIREKVASWRPLSMLNINIITEERSLAISDMNADTLVLPTDYQRSAGARAPASLDQGEKAAQWMSAYLHRDVRLVRRPRGKHTPLPSYVYREDGVNETPMVGQYPLWLASTRADFSTRLGVDILIRRNAAPIEKKGLTRLSIGSVAAYAYFGPARPDEDKFRDRLGLNHIFRSGQLHSIAVGDIITAGDTIEA